MRRALIVSWTTKGKVWIDPTNESDYDMRQGAPIWRYPKSVIGNIMRKALTSNRTIIVSEGCRNDDDCGPISDNVKEIRPVFDYYDNGLQ